MADTIIGKDGVYNFFSSISDMPHYKSGLMKEQVTKITKEEYGNQGLSKLDERLKRVDKKGTSSHIAESLKDDSSFKGFGQSPMGSLK